MIRRGVGVEIKPVTALVPMKYHSQRAPGKNYRTLCGRPLLEWVLDALQQSRHVAGIVVNTDSDEIAEQVRPFGAQVLHRPQHLRGDMVTIQPLIEWDLAHAKGEYFLQTHVTNPLLSTATIDGAIETFFANLDSHDSLFSVTAVQRRFYWPDGSAINHDPAHLVRTQDLPEIFEENSCLYVFTRSGFQRTGHRLGTRPLMYRMNPWEAIDIDEELDFAVAEAAMGIRIGRRPDDAWPG